MKETKPAHASSARTNPITNHSFFNRNEPELQQTGDPFFSNEGNSSFFKKQIPPHYSERKSSVQQGEQVLQRKADGSAYDTHSNRKEDLSTLKRLFIDTQPAEPTDEEQAKDATSIKKSPVKSTDEKDTEFGTFKSMKLTSEGDSGLAVHIIFIPNEKKVNATKIALTQSAKSIRKDPDNNYMPHDPTDATRMVSAGKAAGYSIDQKSYINNPLYAGGKNLTGNQKLDATEQTKLLELGHCYPSGDGNSMETKNAQLQDHPREAFGLGHGLVFETAALAIEGADINTYYGSVSWGFHIGGTPEHPNVVVHDMKIASTGTVPTEKFIEAAKLWNKSKAQGTLMVTAKSATVRKINTKENKVEEKKLAYGTLVKQLSSGELSGYPAIEVEVLDKDGKETKEKEIVWIRIKDVADQKDGVPNVALPIPGDQKKPAG